MEHLIELRLLERNPSHGHPLRPEFRLTERGVIAADMAHKIQKMTLNEDQVILRRSWTLPVLTAIHVPRAFNSIRRDLVTISDRALSQSLQSMQTRGWVDRQIDHMARPPRAFYRAINTGHAISSITASEVTF